MVRRLDEAAQKIEELEAVVRRLKAENNQLMNQQEVVSAVWYVQWCVQCGVQCGVQWWVHRAT